MGTQPLTLESRADGPQLRWFAGAALAIAAAACQPAADPHIVSHALDREGFIGAPLPRPASGW
jgi:hypothetical protein